MAAVRPAAGSSATAKPHVRAAQANFEQEWYDLKPAEKKLVRYLLGIGAGILALLLAVFGVLRING